jgi:hypothetical protein
VNQFTRDDENALRTASVNDADGAQREGAFQMVRRLAVRKTVASARWPDVSLVIA